MHANGKYIGILNADDVLESPDVIGKIVAFLEINDSDLIFSNLNISEIAYAIGHSNPQYFSKWFKSHCKMSPSEYILKNKKKD
jgi:AraC-like DNA-binding protein